LKGGGKPPHSEGLRRYDRASMRGAGVIFSLALFVASGAAALEVSAPATGSTLRGGSVARLAWSAEALPADVDEWEAFLSIDGGAHYAFRITPHLDIALRSVTWLVPNVDTRDARLLIRTGDERKERTFVLPLSFAIARDANAHIALRPIGANRRGESAREGDDPVAGWAEGDRRGTRVAQVTHVDPPAAMQSLHPVSLSDQTSAVVAKSLFVAPLSQTAAAKASNRRSSFVARQLDPASVLLAVGRLNI
jgi:hypothetical protein